MACFFLVLQLTIVSLDNDLLRAISLLLEESESFLSVAMHAIAMQASMGLLSASGGNHAILQLQLWSITKSKSKWKIQQVKAKQRLMI